MPKRQKLESELSGWSCKDIVLAKTAAKAGLGKKVDSAGFTRQNLIAESRKIQLSPGMAFPVLLSCELSMRFELPKGDSMWISLLKRLLANFQTFSKKVLLFFLKVTLSLQFNCHDPTSGERGWQKDN